MVQWRLDGTNGLANEQDTSLEQPVRQHLHDFNVPDDPAGIGWPSVFSKYLASPNVTGANGESDRAFLKVTPAPSCQRTTLTPPSWTPTVAHGFGFTEVTVEF
jgi:hypothetical protein